LRVEKSILVLKYATLAAAPPLPPSKLLANAVGLLNRQEKVVNGKNRLSEQGPYFAIVNVFVVSTREPLNEYMLRSRESHGHGP